MFHGPGWIFLFLSVSSVALFGFLAVASWAGSRQMERESYYKNDMLKKLGELNTPGAAAALQHLRDEAEAAYRRTEEKKREGYAIGGLCNLAVGIALMAFLHSLISNGVFYVGLFPMLIGVALLTYNYVLAPAKHTR